MPIEATQTAKNNIAYKIPTLPKLEIWFYFAVYISHAIYAVNRLIWASDFYLKNGLLNEHYLHAEPSPLITGKLRDKGNYEWENWLLLMRLLVPIFVCNSLLFNVTYRHLKRPQAEVVQTAYSIAAWVYMIGWYPVLVALISLLILLLAVRSTEWKLIAYLLGFLFHSNYHRVMTAAEEPGWFCQSLFLQYKALHLVSFGAHYCENREMKAKDSLMENYRRLVHYAFYLPYSTLVIVLYEDFRQQLDNRDTKMAESVTSLTLRLCRLLLWTAVYELLLHVMLLNAFMNSASVMRRVDLVTLVCVVYMAGQMFHVKYTSVFGFPSWFASVDRMTPPDGPACVSPVMLYSKIWRHFDRGLYQFLKKRFYIPLLQQCEHARWYFKAAALVLSYLFVLQWHGFDDKHRRWITLSVAELLFERLAVQVYRLNWFRNNAERKLGQRMFRRVVAILMIICGAFGCFGAFNFLGGPGVGEVVAVRTWWTHGHRMDQVFWHLVLMAYCISQCDLELDRNRQLASA